VSNQHSATAARRKAAAEVALAADPAILSFGRYNTCRSLDPEIIIRESAESGCSGTA